MARKASTRDRLITTAAELFHRQGFAATGVNEIIRGAGATSGSFYHFFDTKEELLMAVVDHLGATIGERIFDVPTGDSAVASVLAVLAAAREYLEASGPGFGSPVGTLAAELAACHPRVRGRIAELYEGWTSRLEAVLEDAGDRLPGDLDRRGLARAVIGALEGAMLQARIEGDLIGFDATVEMLRGHLQTLESPHDPRRAAPAVTTPPERPMPPAADWRTW